MKPRFGICAKSDEAVGHYGGYHLYRLNERMDEQKECMTGQMNECLSLANECIHQYMNELTQA
jgi:hypothetical protein